MAIISFKCPNCGGELIFDPATQKYKCEYCNSLFTQEELDAMKPMQGVLRRRDCDGRDDCGNLLLLLP